jgi:hypothetical protein
MPPATKRARTGAKDQPTISEATETKDSSGDPVTPATTPAEINAEEEFDLAACESTPGTVARNAVALKRAVQTCKVMFILLTQHITLVINGTPLDCKAFPENWRYVSAAALLPRTPCVL